MKFTAVFIVTLIILNTLIMIITIRSSTVSGNNNDNSVATTKLSSSNDFSKVDYSYLAGDYWTGEILIQFTFFSNNTLYFRSNVTKGTAGHPGYPQLSSFYLTNTSFMVYIVGFQPDFTGYINNSHINLASQWQTYYNANQTNCGDCFYHTYMLNVTAENGTVWSVVNNVPEWKGFYSSDLNSQFSLNSTLDLMKTMIDQYNLNKIGNDQILTLTSPYFSSGSLVSSSVNPILIALSLSSLIYIKRKKKSNTILIVI